MNDRLGGAIFDLGGVVFGSPLDRIAAFERAGRLPRQLVAQVIEANGTTDAWGRLERGELRSPMADLPIADHFDVFVASVTDGVRKPERMGREPAETAMIDDLGANLKTARQEGIDTHEFSDLGESIDWISARFGLVLEATAGADS